MASLGNVSIVGLPVLSSSVAFLVPGTSSAPSDTTSDSITTGSGTLTSSATSDIPTASFRPTFPQFPSTASPDSAGFTSSPSGTFLSSTPTPAVIAPSQNLSPSSASPSQPSTHQVSPQVPGSTSNEAVTQVTKTVTGSSATNTPAAQGVSSSSGFIHNKAAVAGVFAALGLIILGGVLMGVILARRRVAKKKHVSQNAYVDVAEAPLRSYARMKRDEASTSLRGELSNQDQGELGRGHRVEQGTTASRELTIEGRSREKADTFVDDNPGQSIEDQGARAERMAESDDQSAIRSFAPGSERMSLDASTEHHTYAHPPPSAGGDTASTALPSYRSRHPTGAYVWVLMPADTPGLPPGFPSAADVPPSFGGPGPEDS